MPPIEKRPAKLNLKSIIQLVAGSIFLVLGLFIILTKFEENNILIGPTKFLYGGILCLYGIVRLARIYLNWKTQKDFYYEDTD